MKKIMVIFLGLMVLLCGCGANSKMNTIVGVDADTQSEFEIGEEIQGEAGLPAVASYTVDKSFKTVKLTVEAYQNGKLLESRQILEGALGNEGSESSGFIAMCFNHDDEIKILVTEEGEKREMMTDLGGYFENEKLDKTIMATSGISPDDKIEVKAREEYLIVIAQISTDPNEMVMEMPEVNAVAEDMSKLSDMAYALVLKCEFF